MKWSFYQIWNKSLENRKDRELKLRENIWASEIGGAYIDRWLKMKGVKPTNPPNPRSLRKFEAGNMMEWVVTMVLKRAGILIDTQEWVSFQYPGLLEVTGKLDHLAGGTPDWEKAKAEIKELELPEFFDRATEGIIDHLSKKYPNGLEKIIIEVKSCSSFMFDRYELMGAGDKHQLQAFHYLKAKNMSEAHIAYISKDDLRMAEYGVFNPSDIEKIYKADIEAMTKYIKENQEPPKEPEIYFDHDTGKFSTNWKVSYSNYLTKLYGYKDQHEYDEKYKGLVAKWNRVLKRVVDGANMTKLNLEVIDEIKKQFSNYDELVENAKSVKVNREGENE